MISGSERESARHARSLVTVQAEGDRNGLTVAGDTFGRLRLLPGLLRRRRSEAGEGPTEGRRTRVTALLKGALNVRDHLRKSREYLGGVTRTGRSQGGQLGDRLAQRS